MSIHGLKNVSKPQGNHKSLLYFEEKYDGITYSSLLTTSKTITLKQYFVRVVLGIQIHFKIAINYLFD